MYRVAFVYLAPRGVGGSEIGAVNEVMAEGDRAVHLSWEDDIADFALAVADPGEREFVASGVEAVLQDIDDHRGGLPITDERVAVRQIAKAAREELERVRPDVPIYHWGGQNYEDVLTRAGLPFMFNLTLRYPDSGAPDFEPVTDLADGHRTFRFESGFKQGSQVKAKSALGQRWAAIPNEIEIAGIGPYTRANVRDHFVHSETVRGTTEQLVEQIVATGDAIVASIHGLLGDEAMAALSSGEPTAPGS